VIYVGVFPHVTLNGYYDAMGNTAEQWYDVIQILPIQAMTEATYKCERNINFNFCFVLFCSISSYNIKLSLIGE